MKSDFYQSFSYLEDAYHCYKNMEGKPLLLAKDARIKNGRKDFIVTEESFFFKYYFDSSRNRDHCYYQVSK